MRLNLPDSGCGAGFSLGLLVPNMNMSLAFGELPDTWYEVLMLPVFFAVVGVVIWIAGRNAELKDRAKPWKWFAALPFALAAYAGWDPFFRASFDTFYKAAIEPYGKKMQFAHVAAFWIPVFCILGLAVWEYIDRKRASEEL